MPGGSAGRAPAGMSTPTGAGSSMAWVPERTEMTPSSARKRSANSTAVFSAETDAGLPSTTARIFKSPPFDGLVKSHHIRWLCKTPKFKAREHPPSEAYPPEADRSDSGMKRNAEIGFFTKPSPLGA